MLTLSLAFVASQLLVPPAQAAPEFHEGIWPVVSREGNDDWVYGGVVVVKSAAGPANTVAPTHTSTETYCVPANFRWPQVISASPAKNAEWLVLPQSDTQYSGSVDCSTNSPVKVDNATVRTFTSTPCTTSGAGACPATTGGGTASASSSPVIGLKPGVYHVTAHREVGSTRSTGSADVYVRPTGTSGLYVETWCYDSNFLWPRVSQTVASTTYERTWWQFAVGSETAPQNVTSCSAPKSNRADYTTQAN